MLSFQVVINSPYMTYAEYARYTGQTVRQIEDWAKKGRIIIQPKEARTETPLVNVIAMTEKATREALAYMG